MVKHYATHAITRSDPPSLKPYVTITFTVYEEVHGISECGSNRRVDILAFKDNQRGFIIDPTVRFECSSSQPEAVHEEKCAIYQPTVPYYLTKYKLQSITVIGLLVGARGTITKRFTQFVKDFNLHPSLSQHVCLIAIKYSVYLLRNHIYNKWLQTSTSFILFILFITKTLWNCFFVKF